MINPNEVNLIIFDMDGTILPSLPPFFESVKRAFTKLGWPVTFSPEEINRFFGVSTASTTGTVYEFITPPSSHLSVEEVRLKVRDETEGAFREMAQAYPGVKETLKTLRQRGYKLAQYTNATTAYLNNVMSALGLRDYYDYVECIEDNHLTKPELIKKIREHFGGPVTAVVGDRFHDIEAAGETGCLSVGALFGYGGKEPEEADLTIRKFDDLLSIFDRRLPVFEEIFTEVGRRKTPDTPFVVGINGIDGSGKTVFTTELENFLNSKSLQTQTINVDDFHNPKAMRYAGADQPANYYHKSFDIRAIIDKLLKPLREKELHSVTLKLLDLRKDQYTLTKKYSFSPQTIVLFEGIFLFRKELAPYIDYKIFLDIPLELSKKRAIIRDPETDLDKYDTKYLPAQRRYLQEYPPEKCSDIIIDNSALDYPVIIYRR